MKKILCIPLIICLLSSFLLFNYTFFKAKDVFLLTESEFKQLCEDDILSADEKDILQFKNNPETPIRTDGIEVYLIPERFVFAGGMPMAMLLNLKGLPVVSTGEVISKNGKVAPCKDKDIQSEDILTKFNGKTIETSSEVQELLKECSGDVVLTFLRNGKEFEEKITPIEDVLTGDKKLGIWVREWISGLGTISYISVSSLRFGALGHPLYNPATKQMYSLTDGNMYKCFVTGVVKGEKGKAGELKGVASQSEVWGSIDNCNEFGVFGYLNSFTNGSLYAVANRYAVRPGKAKILTTIEGSSPQEYDIEIVKTKKQEKEADKSMIIKITDKRLLEKSAGIVQGMSGSPIIQNDRVVGAVTHVFVNDPTRGYGIYIDWMIDN